MAQIDLGVAPSLTEHVADRLWVLAQAHKFVSERNWERAAAPDEVLRIAEWLAEGMEVYADE